MSIKNRIVSVFLSLVFALSTIAQASVDNVVVYKDNDSNYLKYICGFGDGTIRPDAPLTRAQCAKMLTYIVDTADADKCEFSDVSKTFWGYDAICKLSNAGIIFGYGNGTFMPEKALSRAEFAAIITRIGDYSDGESSFADISGHWAEKEINKLAASGYISGYRGNIFKPNAAITRAEAVKIINKVVNVKINETETRELFSDLPLSHWAYYEIMSATSLFTLESVVGRNLVSSSAPTKHRSKEPGSYNSKTKTWTKFDGSWYSADSKVIAHYMDPRNFISESGIYQFMTHSYDKSSQDAKTVAAVIKGSFMEGKNPGGGYSSYQALINAAGKATGVNPNVLAAMIIQEQGWNGSSLVSGTYKGYKGYYNFYNIGAYTTSTMSAVQRGLWYAKGSGTGATSYSRPWNTPYKSIKGGAQYYAEGYVSKNQDSYYSKKFNVYNGLSNVGSHQYMTFVAAASSEGNIVKRA